ncbi:MAG: LON peptidase substrate-binding domain-containing protein [Bdellovibrionota bacterium]
MSIAIFPIPNCVTYPGQVIPLHVFEPRYRQMIQECIQRNIPVAVCHVKRTVHEVDSDERTLAEALQSDQSTYEPVGVVSFGPIRLEEVLSDGRMIVEARMNKRARIKNFVQEVPYYLAEIEEVTDDDSPPSAEQSMLHAELSARFERIWRLAHPERTTPPFDPISIPFAQLSFQILGFVSIDPVFGQTLLEVRDPMRRGAIVCEILKAAEARAS